MSGITIVLSCLSGAPRPNTLLRAILRLARMARS